MVIEAAPSLPVLLRTTSGHPPVTVADSGQNGTRVHQSTDTTGTPDARPDFERVVAEHADVVWRFAVGMLRNPVDADDATQETFARAYVALDRFRGESSIRTWLLSICRNLCIDHVRRRREVAVGDDVQWMEAETGRDHADGVALRATLREEMADLHADEREAFVLVDVLGFPATQAAEICQVPATTLRSRRQRAHERLVALLTEEVM